MCRQRHKRSRPNQLKTIGPFNFLVETQEIIELVMWQRTASSRSFVRRYVAIGILDSVVGAMCERL